MNRNLALFVASAAALGWSCSSPHGAFDAGSDGAGGAPDSGTDVADTGGSDGRVPMLGEAGPDGGTITVSPAGVVLNPHGKPVSQAYTAKLDGKAISPVWSVAATSNIGKIDKTGVFTAGGQVGGVASIVATAGGAQGQTSVTVNVAISENPGGVSASDQGKLKAGGSADARFRWLYPYDKTVFPRGINPPLLQFDGGPASAIYVHMQSANMKYDGFFSATSPTQVSVTPALWANVAESVGATDPLQVSVTEMDASGNVTGPITETWSIAQGSMHGIVYYTSYTSQLIPGSSGTLKIKVGDTAPTVLIGSCNNCHSVSANGNVLAASYGHTYDATYDLTKSAAKMAQVGDCLFCLPAVYPDGTLLLTNFGSAIPGMGTTNPNTLYDTKTGAPVSFTWLGGTQAAMPAFSPDGTQLVYNHQDTGSGHTLATAKFDVKTRTFSGAVDLVTSPTSYPSWPQFTPDGTSVVYHEDMESDYATWSGNTADMYMADVKTKKAWLLSALDGYKGDGKTSYLPYSGENQLNFEPTVLPVAVGGYFWVVFTSRRYYGNMVTPANYPDPTDNERKKLWVAALDIGATPGTDASHPAFYVDGQEFHAGNMRGFWVLDPCKQDGTSCATADECCGGYCRPGSSGEPVCVSKTGGCSQQYESCTVASDCCDNGALCVNGRCAEPTPK